MKSETERQRQEMAARIDRAIRVPMLVLAIAFLLIVIVQELGDLAPETVDTLEAVNWMIWALFAFELAVMTYLAPDRRRYLREHWIDVLTVLLPFLRPFRILRVVVVSARLWAEARDVIRHRTMSVVVSTSLISSWGAATLVYMAERGSDGPISTYPDALWWAAATITTVGYGDVYPKTYAGRGIALFLMLVGISIFGLLTARVAAFFVEADEQDTTGRKLDEILARLERLERNGGPALPTIHEAPSIPTAPHPREQEAGPHLPARGDAPHPPTPSPARERGGAGAGGSSSGRFDSRGA